MDLRKQNNSISITPSEIIEYLYCPRFVYYMKYLDISQNEKSRYKVMKGRLIHDEKMKINQNYLRKKLGVIDKLIDKKMYSKKYKIHGIVDEILFLNDGTGAPLDYKFAKYNKIYRTLKYQMVMYSLMIEDSYDVSVNRAYLVYTRSKDYVKKVDITDNMKEHVKKIIDEYLKIIIKGYYPKKTEYSKKCYDCTYRKICIL